VTTDDLNAPLGQDKGKGLPKLPATAPQILAGVLGLFGIVVVAWAIFINNPLGGEPTAVVTTGSLAKTQAKPAGDGQQNSHYERPTSDKAVSATVSAPATGSKTITIIDGSSGKQQSVIIPGKTSGN